MTNILPQVAQMKRGAWLGTEELVECYRDVGELRVTGGAIWGRNPDDDFFELTHGIKTPDYFYKVVVAPRGVIAWLIANQPTATRSRLDEYLISVTQLRTFLSERERRRFDRLVLITSVAARLHPPRTWPEPQNCDKS